MLILLMSFASEGVGPPRFCILNRDDGLVLGVWIDLKRILELSAIEKNKVVITTMPI